MGFHMSLMTEFFKYEYDSSVDPGLVGYDNFTSRHSYGLEYNYNNEISYGISFERDNYRIQVFI